MGSFLGNVTFHPHRRGAWQMKDVTQVIKEAWNRGHLLVSVKLDLGQPRHKKSEEELSAGDLPYLLLYANDRLLAEPNSVAASLQRYDPFGEGDESPHSSSHMHPELQGRVRREAALLSSPIENNELPEVDYRPNVYRKDELWESTWYLALKPKLGKKDKKRSHRHREDEQSRKEEPLVLKEEASQGPRDSARADEERHDLRRERKDERRHKGSVNSQSPILSFDAQTMRKARRRQWDDSQRRGCSRRSLRVDFADIGWSEWVIAPKAFDAYYCAGTCGFPMPKVSSSYAGLTLTATFVFVSNLSPFKSPQVARPSNHATIQSIVRAVGIIPGVPEPCCVPEKMSPLAVLYQDEATNRVLKVYPNMSVQSCSCR